MKNTLLTSVVLAVAAAGTNAQEVLVNADIAVSTVWTAGNTYNLQQQIYVLPGATLTIEAGVVVASDTGVGGSLAVTNGAQIFVNGTEDNPVIMTSKADVATWAPLASHPTGKDPKTGMRRTGVNEWGNLTIMGDAYIGSCNAGNTAAPNGNNVAPMEGLVANPMFPTRTLYGGDNDNYDAGSISFLSLRYGGRVIGLNNELNGLSLGGLGRGTDIKGVDIMNNVDDGIEIWGGTVDLKCLSIWNIGDDSLDCDQGWRGRAQFGLIVQGWSAAANQGSGVGDNCIEIDGAEFSDHQPVTTAVVKNFTVIGQQFDGDHGMAYRDNARVQYHNMIFMDIGDDLVRFDNVDGDPCGTGYGHNGTLSWTDTWNTAYNAVPAHPNDPAAGLMGWNGYQAQTSGNLSEVKDSIFFNVADIATATAVGVFNPACNNTMAGAMPITTLTRGAAAAVGPQNKVMEEVLFLDPRPSVVGSIVKNFCSFAQQGGAFTAPVFFESANYAGGFAPGGNLWISGWTAADAYNMIPGSDWRDLKCSLEGVSGAPIASGTGTITVGANIAINLANAAPNSTSALILGAGPRLNANIFGGVFKPGAVFSIPLPTSATGATSLPLNNFPGVAPGFALDWQFWTLDNAAPFGLSASNAISGVEQ